jgi:hypothetical protein
VALVLSRVTIRFGSIALVAALPWLSSMANAVDSPPILVVHIESSYPTYATHEYRYWSGKTISCYNKGPGAVPSGGAGKLSCSRRAFDRRRSAVIALVPSLALVRPQELHGTADECMALDGDAVTISGLWQGSTFIFTNKSLGACASQNNKLVDHLLELVI